jgi:hypothetical protein
MKPPDSGAVPKRVILIQLAILASLAAFYGLYLPFRAKSRAEAEAEERELRIETLFQSLVVEDASPAGGGVEVPGASGKTRAHPQRLNRTPSVGEVVRALGLPDRRATDFRSGLHLTWTGTEHTLQASFDRGRLYCLRWEDRRTGHGALVFESSFAWHPF